MKRTKSDRGLAHMERALQALGDPTRLRILSLLVGGEVCVCHIHEALRVPQPKASRHLAYLRRANLVEARKDGLWVHYRLANVDDAGVVRAGIRIGIVRRAGGQRATNDRERSWHEHGR